MDACQDTLASSWMSLMISGHTQSQWVTTCCQWLCQHHWMLWVIVSAFFIHQSKCATDSACAWVSLTQKNWNSFYLLFYNVLGPTSKKLTLVERLEASKFYTAAMIIMTLSTRCSDNRETYGHRIQTNEKEQPPFMQLDWNLTNACSLSLSPHGNHRQNIIYRYCAISIIFEIDYSSCKKFYVTSQAFSGESQCILVK